ncbi:MAG: FmdB family zinc ribbon protein [Armatimonadota bacterium]
MPIFDYKCADCKSRFTLLIGMVAEREREECPHCGSPSVTRLISRFATSRSEDDLIDSLADPSKMGDLDDPKELAGWMKRVGKEMGEDLGDLDEVMTDDQPE